MNSLRWNKVSLLIGTSVGSISQQFRCQSTKSILASYVCHRVCELVTLFGPKYSSFVANHADADICLLFKLSQQFCCCHLLSNTNFVSPPQVMCCHCVECRKHYSCICNLLFLEQTRHKNLIRSEQFYLAHVRKDALSCCDWWCIQTWQPLYDSMCVSDPVSGLSFMW
jgi:hypothetical protein